MSVPPKAKDWTLDILGKRFSVKWEVPPKNDYGRCDSGTCTITVNPEYHAEQQKDALLHEVMHALDHEVQAHMRERQIRRMATVILHFMRSNPEVVRWLLQRD